MDLCILNLYKVLHIDDGEAFKVSVNADASENVKMDPPKCLNECATFPFSGGANLLHSSSPQEDEMPNEESTSDLFARSYSFPPVLKPLSAMKGSWEKRGASIGKLTVTWAPDVYDPPPTSVSHFLRSGSKQRMAKKDKKNGKKGQKGKDSSKACDSKKRKQYRQISVFSANRHYNLPNDGNPCVVIPLGTNRFEIGSKETCGSDYFMNSLERVHYSATEVPSEVPSEVPPTVVLSSCLLLGR